MNYIALMGRACADPELRQVSTGTAVTRFTLAVDRRYSKLQKEQLQKEGKQTGDFVRIVCWGHTAEHADRFLRKGARVLISGTLVLGRYEKDIGETVYFTEVHAERLQIIDYPERKSEACEESQEEEIMMGLEGEIMEQHMGELYEA